MLRPNDFEAGKIDISALVKDAQSIRKYLPLLETYLNDDDIPSVRSIRARHVEHVVKLMLDAGRILVGTPEYELLYDFYLRNFGKTAPSFAKKGVTYTPGETIID